MLSPAAPAGTHIDWVTVGDAGNANDIHGDGYGGVEYVYDVSKYAVTNAQYTDFLNAVAATDPNGLYHGMMAMDYGGIDRNGSEGSYTYGPKGGDTNWLNRPVVYVDFYDSARFANWLHNGQPNGEQTDATTEDGAYDMSLGNGLARKVDALAFLPNEDEWYKAAFYKGGGIDAGYWDYATQSNVCPTWEPPPGGDNSANYYNPDSPGSGYTIGSPYYSTEVGAYSSSVSAYGTFDQDGNVWEWNETVTSGGMRGLRGGSWTGVAVYMKASYRYGYYPQMDSLKYGFRVACIPEPAVGLLVIGAVGLFRRRRPAGV
ncbi:MAG: SUMF1/EgtB/PvdO family nonheme iron enzyme [Phycisphaerales bacterium]|nr:SUMF1/EgtB/PvdO family nonheme iron enzyme [Phycisphaerales bacterium]